MNRLSLAIKHNSSTAGGPSSGGNASYGRGVWLRVLQSWVLTYSPCFVSFQSNLIRKRKQPAVMFVVNKRILDTDLVEIHVGKGHAFQK